MPIAVRVVSDEAFNEWIEAAKSREWERARNILRAATEEPGVAQVAAASSGAADDETGQN